MTADPEIPAARAAPTDPARAAPVQRGIASPRAGAAFEARLMAVGKGWRLKPGRAWDITAILVSWFGGLLLIGEAATLRRLSDDDVFLLFVAGCLLSLALWWRRSHPVPVAVFLLVGSVITDAAGLAALIALFTVVAHRRGRVIAVLALLHLAAGVVYAVLYPDPSVPHLVSALLTLAILATTIALGMAARSRQELIESLRERTVRAEEEARLRADRLRALERERIAREMHDSLAHRISMVSLHAGALQIRPDLTPAEVATAATTIRDSAHQALEDLREILGVLRSGPGDALRPQPDLRHLDELIADSRKAGVPVTVSGRLDGLPVGASLGRTVYRLVQEGLTNAGKHAPGAPVSLVLDRTTGGELHVYLSNPLRVPAMTAIPGAGNGLVGLAERVGLLDGRFRHGVHSDPRAGLTFDLEAWLPWPASAEPITEDSAAAEPPVQTAGAEESVARRALLRGAAQEASGRGAAGEHSAEGAGGDADVRPAGEADVREIGGGADLWGAGGDATVGDAGRDAPVGEAGGDAPGGDVGGEAPVGDAGRDAPVGEAGGDAPGGDVAVRGTGVRDSGARESAIT